MWCGVGGDSCIVCPYFSPAPEIRISSSIINMMRGRFTAGATDTDAELHARAADGDGVGETTRDVL